MVLSPILPALSSPSFCPSDPAFIGDYYHVGVVVRNILVFVRVRAIL